MSQDPLQRCQELLAYTFRDPSLLETALTHSSGRIGNRPSNERLEFLGDAVLGLVASEYLFKTFPDETEGEMTKIKSVVVSQATLAKVCRHIGLRDFMIVGKGLSVKRPFPASMVANVLEAVIAAIYLDGGLQAATQFVLTHLKDEIDIVRRNQHEPNFKSMLQQFTQQQFGATPVYRVLREEGPDHIKSFHVIAVLSGKDYGSGWGKSKKEAEQRAAEDTLKVLHSELVAAAPVQAEPRPPASAMAEATPGPPAEATSPPSFAAPGATPMAPPSLEACSKPPSPTTATAEAAVPSAVSAPAPAGSAASASLAPMPNANAQAAPPPAKPEPPRVEETDPAPPTD
jgi:ribonuclease-3